MQALNLVPLINRTLPRAARNNFFEQIVIFFSQTGILSPFLFPWKRKGVVAAEPVDVFDSDGGLGSIPC
jgi:hypothetical protein